MKTSSRVGLLEVQVADFGAGGEHGLGGGSDQRSGAFGVDAIGDDAQLFHWRRRGWSEFRPGSRWSRGGWRGSYGFDFFYFGHAGEGFAGLVRKALASRSRQVGDAPTRISRALPPGINFFSSARGVVHQDFAVIHDGDTLAEAVGFVHVVGGEQDGESLLVQGADALPQEEARLRIQVVGGFVEEQDVGRMHERAGDHEALRHAA